MRALLAVALTALLLALGLTVAGEAQDTTSTTAPTSTTPTAPPATMPFWDFAASRRALKAKANRIRHYKGYPVLRFWRRASEISPLGREANLDRWRLRVEGARAKRPRWHSRAAYDRLPAYIRGGFACIHGFEGSWKDTGDPYWGGLQMDYSFMTTYGSAAIRRFDGYANVWPVRVQVIVASRAYFAGRGWNPWPKTARFCGLI